MDVVFKYVLSVSAAISVVLLGTALLGGSISLDISSTPATEWKAERFKTDSEFAVVAPGALSPIYPATPGKELLGKPIVLRLHSRHASIGTKAVTNSVSASRVRQAHATPKLPPQIYAASRDRAYFQTSLSYADDQSRRGKLFAHGLY